MFEIFSDMMKGSKDFFTPERVIVIGIFVILSMFLLQYTNSKYGIMDSMDGGSSMVAMPSTPSMPSASSMPRAPSVSEPSPSQTVPLNGYSSMPSASPSDLLPSDQNSQWAKLNPVNQDSPNMPDLLQAGYHIGLDTIGQTLKNPNLQLRSDPYISKTTVGPWNNSTYEPDLMRVPLEVGCAPA
jgi:hypothetical protein